jgi:chemotaxis protein histidine kinase CheA
MPKSAIELKNLHIQITNEAYILYEALVDLVSENAEKVTRAIETIENYLLNIEDVATKIDLVALPIICEQLRENLIQLPYLAPIERLGLIRQIERWPRLISNYLYLPSEANYQLVNFLSEPKWPKPYSFDLANKLKNSLSQDLTLEKTNLKNPMSDLSNKIIEMSETLSFALEKLINNESESESYLEGLEQYTDTVQSFWELADKMDLKGFQEICLFINDNVFELYSQSQYQKQHLKELFALWPKRVLEYLQVQELGHQNPTLDALQMHALGAEKLLELLCLDSWPISMSKAKANILLTQLIQDNNAFITSINQSLSTENTTIISNNKEADSATVPYFDNERELFELQITDLNMTDYSQGESETESDQASFNSSSATYDAIKNEIELETVEEGTENSLLRFPITELENIPENAEIANTNLIEPQNIEDEKTDFQLSLHEEKNLLSHDKESPILEQELFHSKASLFNDNEKKIANSKSNDEKELCNSEELLFLDDKELAVSEANLVTDDKQLKVCESEELTTGSDDKFTITPFPVLESEISEITENKEQTEMACFELNPEDKLNSDNSLIKQEDFLMTSKALAPDSEDLVTEKSLAFEPGEKAVSSQSPTIEPLTLKESEEEIELVPTPENTYFQFIITKINEEENAQFVKALLSAEADTEVLLEAVMNYTEYVQILWDAAEQKGLEGIIDVCTFLNDNIMALGGEPLSTREAARPLLLAWPNKMLGYLQAPQAGSQELLKLMQQPAWPVPLNEPEELSNKLLSAIEQCNCETNKKTLSMSCESITDTPCQLEVSTEEIVLTSPTDFEVSIPNAQLLIEKINLLDQENAPLTENLITAEEGSEVLLEAVMSYTENVQTLWEEIEQAGLLGLTEICTFINDNVMALGSESLSIRKMAHSLLLAWPEKIVGYLQAPKTNTEELLKLMQETDWPVAFDDIEGLSNKLLMMNHPLDSELAIETDLSSEQNIESQSSEEKQISTSSSINVEVSIPNANLLIEKINDSENNRLIEELITAEDGSERLLEAVMSYTENVQLLWEESEQFGLEGIIEICTFINDNLMALGGETNLRREAARSVLSDWPLLMRAYLQSPLSATEALVTHLQNPAWITPIDDSNALILKEKLTTFETSGQSTEFEGSKQVVMPVTEVELSIPNADLLIEKINDAENTRLIEGLSRAEEGSEALLEAVMSYTEHVQLLWEAAEEFKLEGLTEVCTFINDNVMALGGMELSIREKAHSVLTEWPSKIIAYLQIPQNNAKRLVVHLQNSDWPTPLDTITAESLLEKLLCVPPESTVSTLIETADSTSVEEKVVQLLSQDILELVCNQINDSKEGFSAAIEVCLSMENEAEAFLEAIEEYTTKVQDIWDVAEMANLAGLQEVCTFVNDNLMAFSILDKSQRLATQTYFEKWPVEVLNYLQSPNTGAPNLVSFMQETGWPSPLDASLASELLSTLLTPPQQTETETNLSPQSEERAKEPAVEQTNIIQDLPPLNLEVSGEISLGNLEVLEILISELEFAKEDLTTALNKMIEHNAGEPLTNEAVENYTEVMQRLYAASEMLGLEGLQAFCSFIIDNITVLSTQDKAHKTQAKTLLEQWPALVLAYLAKPTESVIALINHLRQPAWAQPLTDDSAIALFNQLTAGSTAEEEGEEEEAYQRQTTAQPEDVLLTIPEDVNRELLEAYLQETPQHAGDFSTCIQNIIQNPEISEIERAQRIAHTLKGSSNILGIKGIANIAHHLEDTLEYLAKHQIVPPQELTDTMVEAADCIEIMVDALLGQDDPPPQAMQVLQSVLDWANRIDKGKLDAPPVREAAEAPSPTTPTEPAKAESKKTEETNKPAGDAAASTPEQILRVPTKTIDELMRLVGELSISVGQIQERLKHVMHNTRTLTDQNLQLQQKTFELENLVDVRGITGVENRYKKTVQDEEGFDPLEFEEYNELHSVAHSFIESIVDNRELAMSVREDLVELETMFIHQERLNKEFQNNIMTTRMVPMNTILSKLQRNVRQTCRMTGKKAELSIDGSDILIDSDVLNSLGDPLQHILRNAIDHGIENPDERTLLGKAESGTIKLSFYREGNNIVVKCEDDGQGLNYTNIRFTAIQRGLITETQELKEQELARLILMSGFSTKSGVTQVSGRGVGMDVVHTNIRQMKGTLDLMSKTGQGTTILIKLPMTLVTVHVLLVRIGNRRYGIPTNNLEQALAPGVGEFYKVGDEITLKMGKNIYALKSLGSLLNLLDEQEKIDENETRPIILVREETGVTAVVVDELLDTHDLVMKSMGNYVKNLHGVAGASILGDGALVPLLDLPELLRSPMQAVMSAMPQDEQAIPAGQATIPHIMIVDDSLSVRKSLSLLVEDAGFETLLAKDGLEAIEMINQTRPNVMLVDMEMPRMNGLELTAHVRANEATQNLPIFMITSRTTEKHREQAKNAGVNAYLTKPYQDTELLDLIDKALAGGIV